MRMVFKAALVSVVACYAGSAFAFFDVEVTAGKRWYEQGSGDTKGKFAAQEFDVSAHLDPIPLVPVSFGVMASVINPRKDDLDADKAAGFQAGLDVQGWLPFVPVITPYARLTLPLVGTWGVEGKTYAGNNEVKYESTSKVSGYRLAVGGKYDLLPVLKLLFEVSRGVEKMEITEYKVDGVTDSSVKGQKDDLNSNAVMLGVEMGL